MILVSSKPLQSQPIGHLKMPKICPLPVKSFIGRKEILDKMCQYFNSGHKSQHVFVLHGLGGAGKSQLAFKFLEDAQTNHWYVWYYYIYDEYIIKCLSGSLIFFMLMPQINRHWKLTLQLSLLLMLRNQLMHASTGFQLNTVKIGFFSLIMLMMSS